MEGTFAAILGRQEREDAAAAHSEAALRQAVCREFLNGEELLAACGLCLTDFFAAERTALPAVPVRTAAKFGIKKHTASQRPYRHGHDFYELICVHGGCCRQRVGDAPLLLAQGQCCLLPPGAEHEIERCGGRRQRCWRRRSFLSNRSPPKWAMPTLPPFTGSLRLRSAWPRANTAACTRSSMRTG